MPNRESHGEYVVDHETNGPESSRSHMWPLIIFFVIACIAMVAYGMYHSNQYEDELATHLTGQFHGVLAEQDWQRLYSEADPQFKEKYTETAAVAIFSSVSAHMGTPVSSKILSKSMQRGDGGSYMFATVESTFTNQAKAIEHLSWHETNGIFQLNDYSIQAEK
jgi:hypothetical protein